MFVLSLVMYVIALTLAFLYAHHKNAGLFEPITQFLFFFALFTLPLPIRLLFTQEIEGDISDQLPYFSGYIPPALFLCAIGLPLFLWAYFSLINAKIAKRLPIPGSPKTGRVLGFWFTYDRTRLTAIAICLLSLWMVSRLTDGSILGFLLLGYGSTEAMIGKGYLAAGIPWFFVGSMLFLYRYACRRTKVDLLIFGVLFLLQLGALLLLGDRHSILNYTLVVAIFWNFAIRPIRLRKIMVLGVLGLVALNLIGFMRNSNYDSLNAFASSVPEAFQGASATTENMFYTVTNGEFLVTFETLPQIMRKLPSDEIWPRFGLTYLRAPVFFIPQAIFPARPLPLTNWYMKTFYGGTWAQNTGRQFFFLSEGYLNFGPAGVLLTMIVWGFLLGVLNQYRCMNSKNHGATLLYAICCGFMFRAMVGDASNLIVGLAEQFLAITIIGLWISSTARATQSSLAEQLRLNLPKLPNPSR